MIQTIFAHIMHFDIPVLEKILRSIIVYLFLVVALRLAGKREVSQLNPLDFVVLLTLSNTVQNAIIGNDTSVSGGLIGAATLLLANYITIRFLYSSPKLERLVEGTATVVMSHGVIHEAALKNELITHDELRTAAHKQGFRSLHEVERAILEPDGTLSFLAKQPTPESARHQEVMEKLAQLHLEMEKLKGQLK